MSLKERLGLKEAPLYLIDGSTFVYRGFYAFPELKRSDGLPTNALFIVLRILFRLLREEDPTYLGFFLDGRRKTFRHDILDTYKGQRQATPEGLLAQMDPIKEAVTTMGLKLHVSDHGEADDCIASLAARYKKERPVVIVGSDKDLNQCLDKNVVIWDPGIKTEKLITLESFKESFGMEPAHWPDYQALVGDSSDNIPGVPGVGPKTAMTILERFPTLEALRDNLEALKPAERKKIEPHMDAAFTYRELTRLRTGYCEDMDLADFRRIPPDNDHLRSFLQAYEFRSMLGEIPAPREEFLPLLRLSRTDAGPAARNIGGEIPDVAGREVGLLALEDGFHLGLGGEELLYTGPAAPLAKALAGSSLLSTPSFKDLLSRDPAWSAVPCATWFDLSLAAYLLNPEERNYSWDRLRQTLAGELPGVAMPMGGKGTLALALGKGLTTRLENAGLLKLMQEMEMPLIPVLVGMEKRGIRVDLGAFGQFLEEVNNRLDELTTSIHSLAGGPFNIRSSQQLGDLLFQKLGLKAAGRTPGGSQSTAVPVLMRLEGKHPIIGQILEYRKLEKLRSTYLEPMPGLVDGEGRVHTTFNNLATATGRLSSSGPNLQNIPIRGEFGKRMRSCFVAAEGQLLAAADYSQIELRLLAAMSGDPALLEAFKANEDIHRRTAALLFDKLPEGVTSDERRRAKTINFGLLYGMGPQRLGQELGVSLKEAKEFIAKYFSRMSRLREFYEAIVEEAKENGFVTTIAGRRRLLQDINSRNNNLAEAARRQAINTRVQGSAADIIKMAMLAADNDHELKRLGAHLLLQVHDELLLEAPEANARAAGERLAAIMRGVYSTEVPLAVDWGVGRNWGEAH